jgi:hypothetical protein
VEPGSVKGRYYDFFEIDAYATDQILEVRAPEL